MRIGSDLHGTGLAALANLNNIYNQLSAISLQLSTGIRLNRGSDDPAGLIAAESLRSELAAMEQASRNAAHAGYALSVADAAMGQSMEILRTVRANVVAAADGNLTDQQRAILQYEVDAALQQLNQIGATTQFGGQMLLDGSTLEFQISSDLSDTVSLEMPQIAASALGGAAGLLSDLTSGGSANLQDGDLEQAQAILDQAEQQILAARAQTGAFEKYTLDSSSNVLDAMQINMTAALSEIRDTDMAQAMSNLIRTQILAESTLAAVKFTTASRGLVLELL